eukprot:TRINITY_DN4460_c0_g1_i1.p1 TRINITY_DN4460_c0_g1~~TRINITY_DN4460_c0_g1_i1.p1  ORF type:complete len:216 (-),score=38.92 TRINITY_DN4460_c0_g1_i1:117-680(-)
MCIRDSTLAKRADGPMPEYKIKDFFSVFKFLEIEHNADDVYKVVCGLNVDNPQMQAVFDENTRSVELKAETECIVVICKERRPQMSVFSFSFLSTYVSLPTLDQGQLIFCLRDLKDVSVLQIQGSILRERGKEAFNEIIKHWIANYAKFYLDRWSTPELKMKVLSVELTNQALRVQGERIGLHVQFL